VHTSFASVLGAEIGRRAPDRIEALVWGHQVISQLRPDEVRPLEKQGKRHFGVVLPWNAGEALAVGWQPDAADLPQHCDTAARLRHHPLTRV